MMFQNWLEENESDPVYQILSNEEIVAKVVGTEESSSRDEDNEMRLTVPKLSEVCSCMDAATARRKHQ